MLYRTSLQLVYYLLAVDGCGICIGPRVSPWFGVWVFSVLVPHCAAPTPGSNLLIFLAVNKQGLFPPTPGEVVLAPTSLYN